MSAKFWAKVNKDGPLHPVLKTKCWLWTGALNEKGYGKAAGNQRAHRVSFAEAHGEIPAGKCVLHHCDVRNCVNNEGHLFLGTPADNTADMMQKGRHYSGIRPRGEGHHAAKLKAEQVLAIRVAVGRHQDIAADYGVSKSTVRQIKARLLWRDLE